MKRQQALCTQPEYQRGVEQDQAYPTQEERPREVPPQLWGVARRWGMSLGHNEEPRAT